MQEARDELKRLMMRGDIPRAKVIYRTKTGKIISNNYIQAFIAGSRINLGRGLHKPEDIYAAVADAIMERLEKQRRLQHLVDEISASTKAAVAAAAAY